MRDRAEEAAFGESGSFQSRLVGRFLEERERESWQVKLHSNAVERMMNSMV